MNTEPRFGSEDRYCLIRTRTQGIRDYPSFLKEIIQGKEALKRDGSQA